MSVTLDIRWVADRIVNWIRYHRKVQPRRAGMADQRGKMT
jgi:hypothetical protein